MNSKANGRPKIGLALSGGVARGPAHVGVLSVLEREGIPIDCAAGTSAGSIIGAAYCAGLEIPELRELSLTTSWRDVAKLTLSRQGLVTFSPMVHYLENLLGPLDIRDLAIPFTIVVTDLERGERVLLTEGRLATAVQASSSVPGLVTPVEINGRAYYDGGVMDNLPVDAVRLMGADIVIGVDLMASKYNPSLGAPGAALTALELMIRYSGYSYHAADCLIVPDIAGYNYLDLSHKKSLEYMLAGERAAEAALPAIKKHLHSFSTNHKTPQNQTVSLHTDTIG